MKDKESELEHKAPLRDNFASYKTITTITLKRENIKIPFSTKIDIHTQRERKSSHKAFRRINKSDVSCEWFLKWSPLRAVSSSWSCWVREIVCENFLLAALNACNLPSLYRRVIAKNFVFLSTLSMLVVSFASYLKSK